tara:strand:- start:324 stop:602 length:279 start_codon:yes stop_codon:yes gene_type:complete
MGDKIGNVISDIFNKKKYSGKLNKIRLSNIISEIFDYPLSNYIEVQQFKNKVLYLKVNSCDLKNELSSNKNIFLQKINSYFNKDVIKDIQIS